MKITELRQAVEQIELDDVTRQRIIKELKKNNRKSAGGRSMAKAAAALAACVLALGILSVPVHALVASLVRERMEKMPEEEIAAVTEQMEVQDESKVNADSFSRDYTEGEKARWIALYKGYQKGAFPQGEIARVDSREEAQSREFCYLTTISRFYLPSERELTDEEILEIIDFNQKRDYALEQQYKKENAEEIAAKEKEKQAQIKELLEDGGITEQQAVDIAKGYLSHIFGLSGEGMELNHYYAKAGERYEEASYGVNWSIQSHAYYYFFISAEDGRLIRVSCSGDAVYGSDYEAKMPAPGEAPERAASIRLKASDFLTELFGSREDYEKIESCYFTWDEEKLSTLLYVIFTKTDGSLYRLSYTWDGNFVGLESAYLQDHEAWVEGNLEMMTKQLSEKAGREVHVKAVREG